MCDRERERERESKREREREKRERERERESVCQREEEEEGGRVVGCISIVPRLFLFFLRDNDGHFFLPVTDDRQN